MFGCLVMEKDMVEAARSRLGVSPAWAVGGLSSDLDDHD